MQIGCGQTVKTINGISYLYFWWFEDVKDRRVQKFRCMGREEDPASIDKANQMTFEYYVKSRRILDRLIQQI